MLRTHFRSFGRSFVRSFVRSDNVKTVYPPTNTVCGGYNHYKMSQNTCMRSNHRVQVKNIAENENL